MKLAVLACLAGQKHQRSIALKVDRLVPIAQGHFIESSIHEDWRKVKMCHIGYLPCQETLQLSVVEESCHISSTAVSPFVISFLLFELGYTP